jgi:hypothetical protein
MAASPKILEQHLADLRGSAIDDETIAASGVYSEQSPKRIAELLRWKRPLASLAPALIFPYSQLDGSRNGFAVCKPDVPRLLKGKVIKYESPKKGGLRAYFTPLFGDSLADPSRPIIITEGQKKILSAESAGLPGIGISGFWGWTKKRGLDVEGRGKGPRELIDDLASIEWASRTVVLVFDADPRHNPDMSFGVNELAKILIAAGATVCVASLPIGGLDVDWVPTKVGLDDFIVANGQDVFRDLVKNASSPPPSPRKLDDYRDDLAAARLESVGVPGVNLDRSPPGAGKSFADMPAAKRAKKSLSVVRTHDNAKEVEGVYLRHHLDVARYPQLTPGNDQDPMTCENFSDASEAINSGLSVSTSVCLNCRFESNCLYRLLAMTAANAAHGIATHKRAELSFPEIAKGRPYISVHEDASDLLRPTMVASKGFEVVEAVAHQSKADVWLDGGRRYYYDRLEQAAIDLRKCLIDAKETRPLEMPPPADPPRNTDQVLWASMNILDVRTDADTLRLCRAVAEGQLDELVVRVDRVHRPGGKLRICRSILGVYHSELPKNATIWLGDATASHEDVETMAGCPVVDRTPEGRLEGLHPIIQHPIDITQRTSPGVVLALLRGVFETCPNAIRIGVICHRDHVAAISGEAKSGSAFEEHYRERVAKVEYFRSGEGRGSNAWIDECDLLVVMGTPRVPPSAIRTHLVRLGRVVVAAKPDSWTEWGRDYWSGVKPSGQRVTIHSRGYRDHFWRRAYRSIVVSELIQSIGRGRSICPNGIPTIVISAEDVGSQIAENDLHPVSESGSKVLLVMRELSAQSPTGLLSAQSPNNNIGKRALSLSAIVSAVRIPKRRTIKVLHKLHNAGLVSHVGQRGGWMLSPHVATSEDERPAVGGDGDQDGTK